MVTTRAATGDLPVSFSISAAGPALTHPKTTAPNSTTPAPASNPQTPIHPTAHAPARCPGGKQTAATASTAPKGCKVCAIPASPRAAPDSNPPTRPNSIPRGTITRGANRNINSITPMRAIPIRASTAIPAQAAAPAVAHRDTHRCARSSAQSLLLSFRAKPEPRVAR